MISEEIFEKLKEVICSEETNKLSIYPYNILKLVHSDASIDDYDYILGTNEILYHTIGVFSFVLPEHLCIEGKEVEIYEITEGGVTTIVRLNQKFHHVVYFDEKKNFIEIIGMPKDIKDYIDRNLSDYNNYISNPLKTVFQIALFVPNIGDDVKDTAIKRSLIRKSIQILNRFADCRRYINNNLYGVSEPHYSFNSFDCAFLKEFDLKGNWILSEKYLLNASRLNVESLPMFIDPDQSVINKFRILLKNEQVVSEFPSLMFRKGIAYYGRGQDIAAIKFCVSAVEAILRKWAVEAESQGKIKFRQNENAKGARIKDLKGKFYEIIYSKKPVDDPNNFIKKLDEAITLRHSIEHRDNYEVDSLKIQNNRC